MHSSFGSEETTPAGKIEQQVDGIILPGGAIAGHEKALKAAKTPEEIKVALGGLSKTVIPAITFNYTFKRNIFEDKI
jgi:hypothetical protein